MLSEIRRTRQDGGLALFEEALAELANHNSTPDLILLREAMHLAHITKNKQLADAVLRATESVQQFPSDLLKGIYNYYVAIAAEFAHEADAQKGYELRCALGDVESFVHHSYIKSLYKAKNYTKALMLITQLEAEGITNAEQTMRVRMLTSTGNGQELLRILDAFFAAPNVFHDNKMFTAMTIAISMCISSDMAISCLRRYKAEVTYRGLELDIQSIGSLITALCRLSAIKEAEQEYAMLEKNSKLMQIATQKSSISTTAGLESAMIDMYVRNEKLRRASRHVSRLLNLPQLADTAYGSLVKFYTAAGQFDKIEMLIADLSKASVAANRDKFCTSILRCAAKSPRATPDGIEAIVRSLSKWGYTPNLNDEVVLIKFYLECGLESKARKRFAAVSKKDFIVYSTFIFWELKHNRFDAAFELFDSMLNEGVQPDLVLVTRLKEVALHMKSKPRELQFQAILDNGLIRHQKARHMPVKKYL